MTNLPELDCHACGNKHTNAHVKPALCKSGPRKGKPKKNGELEKVPEKGKPFKKIYLEGQFTIMERQDNIPVTCEVETDQVGFGSSSYTEIDLYVCTNCNTVVTLL